MWYGSLFEESFERALKVYDMTYKQAIAWVLRYGGTSERHDAERG